MTYRPIPPRRPRSTSAGAGGCLAVFAVLVAVALQLAILAGAVYVVVWVLRATEVIPS